MAAGAIAIAEDELDNVAIKLGAPLRQNLGSVESKQNAFMLISSAFGLVLRKLKALNEYMDGLAKVKDARRSRALPFPQSSSAVRA